MTMIFDGITMEETIYVNKIPYKYFTVSAPLDSDIETEHDVKMFDYYKNLFNVRGEDIVRKQEDGKNRAIYYTSVPKVFIKDELDRAYQLYDVININDKVDSGRGKDLILSLTYKMYNFKVFKDYNLDNLYIYVETAEQTNV